MALNSLQPQLTGASKYNDDYFRIKAKIQDRILEMVDLTLVDSLDNEELSVQIRTLINRVLSEEMRNDPLNASEKESIYQDILDEIMGLGPLEPFLKDPSISDVLVNTYNKIYLERRGQLQLTSARFKDNDHLMRVIEKIVTNVGRRVDESNPMVDARLKDGSRVNAIIPPLAIDGPLLSIRRFSVVPLEITDLVALNSLPETLVPVLEGIVRTRLNVLVSGGTGTGKTSMLNVLSRFIPESERIVTIEDAAELQLVQEHLVRMETRPANIEGKGEITQRELVKNSLRMRPDRIIVGEVRGGEAFDMLQAMNTGHDGSLTTIHSNSPRDALMRLETIVAMAGLDIPTTFIRRYIASAIDVLIQLERMADGTRKITSLQEITGMEGDLVTMQELFRFQKDSMSEDGKVKGRFFYSGVLPHFVERFKAAGVILQGDVFNSNNVVEV